MENGWELMGNGCVSINFPCEFIEDLWKMVAVQVRGGGVEA